MSPSSEEEEEEELEEEESVRLQCQGGEQCSPAAATDRAQPLGTHLRVKSMVLFMISISGAAGVDVLRARRRG